MAASVVCVGVPRLVILALETLITPVPFGSKTILPFVFVDEIVLPSIVILSTSTDVNPFKSVIVPPSDVSSEPIVIPSLASCAFETPPDLILTAPEDTEKSADAKEATPLFDVDASSPAIVNVSPETAVVMLVPPATVNVSLVLFAVVFPVSPATVANIFCKLAPAASSQEQIYRH